MKRIDMCETCPLPREGFDNLRAEGEKRIQAATDDFLLMAELHDVMGKQFKHSREATDMIDDSAQDVHKIGEMTMDVHGMLDEAAEVVNAVACGDTADSDCPRYRAIRAQYGDIGRTLLAKYADFLSSDT